MNIARREISRNSRVIQKRALREITNQLIRAVRNRRNTRHIEQNFMTIVQSLWPRTNNNKIRTILQEIRNLHTTPRNELTSFYTTIRFAPPEIIQAQPIENRRRYNRMMRQLRLNGLQATLNFNLTKLLSDHNLRH